VARETLNPDEFFGSRGIHPSSVLRIGLGVTAIGIVGHDYIQNENDISAWNKAQDEGRLSTVRGLRMSDDDLIRQHVIHQLMCRYRLSKTMVREEAGVEWAPTSRTASRRPPDWLTTA
jgi:coproporphyrinogen III oxidase-like Fe-S oxidoreductase